MNIVVILGREVPVLLIANFRLVTLLLNWKKVKGIPLAMAFEFVSRLLKINDTDCLNMKMLMLVADQWEWRSEGASVLLQNGAGIFYPMGHILLAINRGSPQDLPLNTFQIRGILAEQDFVD